METSGHDIGQLRLCKLSGCANELDSDTPTRGRHANICRPCLRGDTIQGRLWRENLEAQPAPVAAAGGHQQGEPSLEQLAKAVVPHARELEKRARAHRDARSATADAVTTFSTALQELRDAAKRLIGPEGGSE